MWAGSQVTAGLLNGTSSGLGYAPNDHSIKTRRKPERGPKIYLALQSWSGCDSDTRQCQVKFNGYSPRDQGSYQIQLPLAVILPYKGTALADPIASKLYLRSGWDAL